MAMAEKLSNNALEMNKDRKIFTGTWKRIRPKTSMMRGTEWQIE